MRTAKPAAVDDQAANSPGLDDGSGFTLDLEALRLSQDFETMSGVKAAHLVVKVRKPDRQEFIRVHPDPEWAVPMLVLIDKVDRETFLVAPALQAEIAHELVPVSLHVTITRQNHLFVWPVRIPGTDGRINDWHASALTAAQLARTQWIRVQADMQLGGYEGFIATGKLPAPEWPDLSRQLIYERAFKDRFIRDADHPVLKRLRGEA